MALKSRSIRAVYQGLVKANWWVIWNGSSQCFNLIKIGIDSLKNALKFNFQKATGAAIAGFPRCPPSWRKNLAFPESGPQPLWNEASPISLRADYMKIHITHCTKNFTSKWLDPCLWSNSRTIRRPRPTGRLRRRRAAKPIKFSLNINWLLRDWIFCIDVQQRPIDMGQILSKG